MTAKKKNSALMKPVHLSAELEEIVGEGPMPRTEVVKKLWAYIKKNNCQDKKNRRMINPDPTLAKVLGKTPLNMFDMTKKVSKHIK